LCDWPPQTLLQKPQQSRSPSAWTYRNASNPANPLLRSRWQPVCNTGGRRRSMHLKVWNGTAPNSETNLCTTCRLSTIVRGRSLDEEIVQCHALSMRAARLTFKVTYCSAYSDARQPSYVQMVENAWILQPGSKKRPAGFIRGADLPHDELADMMVDIHQGRDE
jgi:hypothetical protein